MATSGIDFSDLGGHRVSPPAAIDFSDLGGKRILTPPAAISNAASKKWNPVEEAKTRWDLSDYDDPTIYKHLSDPATFRSTFPEYDHLGDDEIAAGMQRTGARNPNYVGTGI